MPIDPPSYVHREPTDTEQRAARDALTEIGRALAFACEPPETPLKEPSDPDAPPAEQARTNLALLHALEYTAQELEGLIADTAKVAGATGAATYADLGDAVGISRQSARTRWPGAVTDTQPGRPRAPQPRESGVVMVVYRNAAPKIDESGRVFGETGTGEKDQIESDRKWWRIAAAKRRRLRGVVYVYEGVVARVRAVNPQGVWAEDARGYASIPVTAPLTNTEIGQRLPTLGLRPGSALPQEQGPSRRYLEL